MLLKKWYKKWLQFKNLPILTELQKISYSVGELARYEHIQMSGGGGGMPYQSVAIDNDMRFIGRASDEYIIPYMRENHRCWADKDIEKYISLANKYSSHKGTLAFDIGANIGTTSIYMAKKYNIDVIAFEPEIDNFNILKCNCILNNVEGKVKCENIALSDKTDKKWIVYNQRNPGASKLIENGEKVDNATEVFVLSLDDYIKSNKINIENISYIWIDTEGYEAECIAGALNTLKENPVPLFTEMNYKVYKQKGLYKAFIKNVSELYTHFVDMDDFDAGLHPIEDIASYINTLECENKRQTDFCFIKQ